MVASHVAFAVEMHRKLRTPATAAGAGAETVAWSPYSVAAALGLAATGSQGRTREELTGVLVPGGNLEDLARMLAASAALPGADVAVTNTLWVRAGLSVAESFHRSALSWPGAAVHTADFAARPDAARAAINADVEKATRGLITDLLGPGTITATTAAVVANALYLKVAWRLPFAPEATVVAPFHAPSGVREAPTMRQSERMRYAEAGGWRRATLPTASDAVVDVLLPPAEDVVLTGQTLAALDATAASALVDLALPRFAVRSRVTLDAILRDVGVTTAFTSDADFSPITGDRPMALDTVVHQAVLRVDEHGFEGAAATAAVMRLTSFTAADPVSFVVDRPFVLMVRHAVTGAVYFLASITDPA